MQMMRQPPRPDQSVASVASPEGREAGALPLHVTRYVLTGQAGRAVVLAIKESL